MPLTTIHKDTNPNLSTDGRHVATMRLCFVAGLLHQLWNPCDWSTDEPEWRPVEIDSTAPVAVDAINVAT